MTTRNNFRYYSNRSTRTAPTRSRARRWLGPILGLLVALLAGAPTSALATTPAQPLTRVEVDVHSSFLGDFTFAASSCEGGLLNTGFSTGGGGGAGRAALQPITLTKSIDAASAALLEAVATGGHSQSVTIRVFQRDQKNGGETLVQVITAVDVIVTEAHTQPSPEGQSERVGLAARTVTFAYPVSGTSFTFNSL